MERFVTFSRIADLQQRYAALIAPGSLCFDVGANYGERTATFLSLGARVVAVEPQPELATFIADAFGSEGQKDGNLTVVNAALGSKCGSARFYPASDATKSMSTMSEAFLEVARANGVAWDLTKAFDVEVLTLDRMIDDHSLPNYCKIDVEGYDLDVLRGLSRPIDLISFEYNTQRRLIGIAIESIKYLDALDDYCFNYQAELPGQQQLQLSNWVSASVMCYVLIHDIARHTCYGDLFARCRIIDKVPLQLT